MRKNLIAASVGFIVILLFVTFFSRSVLYFVTPKVLVSNTISWTMTDDGGNTVPLTALLGDDSVYVIRRTDGFSGEILRIEKILVTVLWRDEKDACVIGLTPSDIVVTDWDRELRDGQRVILPVS